MLTPSKNTKTINQRQNTDDQKVKKHAGNYLQSRHGTAKTLLQKRAHTKKHRKRGCTASKKYRKWGCFGEVIDSFRKSL